MPFKDIFRTKKHDNKNESEDKHAMSNTPTPKENNELRENENKQGVAPNTQKTGYPENNVVTGPQAGSGDDGQPKYRDLRDVPDTERVARDPRGEAEMREKADGRALRNQQQAEHEAGRNPDGTKPAGQNMVGGHEVSEDRYGKPGSEPRPQDSRTGKSLILGGLQADGSTVERLFLGSCGTRPVSGLWRQGDVVFNSTPSPGGFAGWICVASTTLADDGRETAPAVWRGYGLIEP